MPVGLPFELAPIIAAVVLGATAFKRMIFWLIVIVLEHWFAQANRK